MSEFEVVTGFFTFVPWLSGGFLIFGIVASIGLAILLGWWIGKSPEKRSANLWLSFGWIPLFGIFAASVFTGSIVYIEARNNLSKQIEVVSNIKVVTFIRGDDTAFVGTKDGILFTCRLLDKDATNDIYTIDCP